MITYLWLRKNMASGRFKVRVCWKLPRKKSRTEYNGVRALIPDVMQLILCYDIGVFLYASRLLKVSLLTLMKYVDSSLFNLIWNVLNGVGHKILVKGEETPAIFCSGWSNMLKSYCSAAWVLFLKSNWSPLFLKFLERLLPSHMAGFFLYKWNLALMIPAWIVHVTIVDQSICFSVESKGRSWSNESRSEYKQPTPWEELRVHVFGYLVLWFSGISLIDPRDQLESVKVQNPFSSRSSPFA